MPSKTRPLLAPSTTTVCCARIGESAHVETTTQREAAMANLVLRTCTPIPISMIRIGTSKTRQDDTTLPAPSDQNRTFTANWTKRASGLLLCSDREDVIWPPLLPKEPFGEP